MEYKSSMTFHKIDRTRFPGRGGARGAVSAWLVPVLLLLAGGASAGPVPGPPPLLGWIADLDPGARDGGMSGLEVMADGSTDTARVSLRLEWGHFGLGTAGALSRRAVRLASNVPLGRSGNAIACGYGAAEEWIRLNGASADRFRLRAPGFVYLGLHSRERAALGGTWNVLGLISGGESAGGALRLDWRRRGIRISGAGWTGMRTAASLRAPSVAGAGLHQAGRNRGGSGSLEAELALGDRTRLEVGAGGEIRRLEADGAGASGRFLTLSPDGDAREKRFHAGIRRSGAFAIRAFHFRRRSSLLGPILKDGQGAGKLFYADGDFRRGLVELELPGRGSVRSIGVGRDRYRMDLSGRLETWAFADLWAQTVVSAFRARGLLDASLDWIEFRRRPAGRTGWTVALTAGRFEFRLEEEDWQVGPLGFGRSAYRNTVLRTRGAWVAGAELGRSFPLGGGRLAAGIRTALPVAGRVASNRKHISAGDEARDEGWPGEVSAVLTSAW